MWSTIRARALLLIIVASCAEHRDPREIADDQEARFQDIVGGSLIASPSEEKLRRDRALAITLADTLSALPGVDRARVHLSLADKSLASRDRNARSKAAILIVPGASPPPAEERVKHLAQAAVPGLEGGDVAVFFTRPEKRPRQTVFIGPIEVVSTSATKLKVLMSALLGLLLVMGAGLVIAGYRLRKRRKDAQKGV
jgi:type III secretory pathway lipoprotein EscJ